MYIGKDKPLCDVELDRRSKAVIKALADTETETEKISHAQAVQVLEHVKSVLATQFSIF